MKLSFTPDEKSWLHKNFSRYAQAVEKRVDEKKLDRKLIKIVEKLTSKFGDNALSPSFDRNELRIVQTMVREGVAGCETAIIEYKSRGELARLVPYVEKARAKHTILLGLLSKVEDAL
jgi:hypothetical protein